jgi:hypothetical protein
MLPESFLTFLAVFERCFTTPSYQRFLTMMTGWVLCVGKRTVTGVMRAAGMVVRREHSGYHRFFSKGRWEPDEIGLSLMRLVVSAVLPKAGRVVVSVDDTLARHTGKHIASAGMHRDPLLSCADRPFWHFGHNWVVLAVVVFFPRWNKSYSLPVLVRLYRTEKLNKALGRTHRKKTELASELLTLVSRHFPELHFSVVGDNAYVNRSVFRPLSDNVDFVGRGRMDAALYEPAPEYQGIGRPRVRGDKVASPQDRRTTWRSIDVDIYGRPATVQVRVFSAVWYRVSYDRSLLFAVIRGWPGHAKDDVLVSTDLELTPEQVIRLYCKRWSLEETFGSVKSRLGFEDPQNRCERAVQRTAPMALWTYSLVIVWYAVWAKGRRRLSIRPAPWYRRKKVPSFADMLATLRRQSWTLILSDQAGKTCFDQNAIEPLLDAVGYG